MCVAIRRGVTVLLLHPPGLANTTLFCSSYRVIACKVFLRNDIIAVASLPEAEQSTQAISGQTSNITRQVQRYMKLMVEK